MNTINEDLQFIRDHQAGVRTAPTYWTGWNSLAHRLAAEVERLREIDERFDGLAIAYDSLSPLMHAAINERNDCSNALILAEDSERRKAAEVERLRGALAEMTGYRNEVAEAANSHADDARNRQVEIERLREENKALRDGLSLVADNIGNGSFASPDASLDFLSVEVPKEVKLYCQRLRDELANAARALKLADSSLELAKQALTPPAK